MNALTRCFLRLLTAVLLGLSGLSAHATALTVTPAAVSNTYSGTITLQVTGLSGGSSVVVQKYFDINANGAVDANDLLMQQFSLTDGQPGMVIGGVTNINVPGDTDGAANGQITATLSFPGGDPSQEIIGKYLFVLSSPAGQSTSAFTVTNFPYAQKITGTVVSHGTNVPNAVVILFPPPRSADSGPGNPVALAVANNAGSYTIQAPVGSYVPLAFKNDYVANFGTSPMLTLGSGQTITTNLVLTNATASISGKLADLNSGAGIPGIFFGNGSRSGFIATCSTDSNGSFTERVTADYWSLEGEPSGLMVHGYVGYNGSTNINTTGGSVSGLVFPFPKATALFYGTIKDANNLPLAGIDVYAHDNYGEYSAGGYSDANGNYAVGVLGGLSDDSWQVGVDTGGNSSNPANYIFSQPAFVQNGGTNLNAGQAVRTDFTALLATNQISGNVQFNGANVVGVQVYASATINGIYYNPHADTDASGNYSFNVGNGNWSVGVNAHVGNNSLDAILGAGNYAISQNQNVAIANNNGTANFNVRSCSGVQILTTSLPDGQVGSFYNQWLQASSCSGNINWSLNDPQDFPSDLRFASSGEIYGTPATAGTYHFSVHADDGNGHSANQNLSLTVTSVSQPLQLTTTWLPEGTNTEFYSQTLQAFGGQPPYTWSLAPYSGALPPNLSLSSDGVLSGTLATNGASYFYVRVTDAAQTYVDSSPALYLYIASLPLRISTTSLPGATVGVGYTNQLTATGGQPPYQWSLALGSAHLPAGLEIAEDGTLSGIPTTAGDFNFILQVTDMTLTSATAPLSLHVTASAAPTLAVAGVPANGQLQLRINGNPGQTYTLQYSLDLNGWQQLLTTNAPASTFTVTDTTATNAFRFYRVQLGQ